MHFDSSLEEGFSLIYALFEKHGDPPSQSTCSCAFKPDTPTNIKDILNNVEDPKALITPAPELRIRTPLPEPQNAGACSQAEQSASQAIQQANQSASQAAQQASQSASQSIQQAQQSANQAASQASQQASQQIQQFSNSASQSIAAASRSAAAADSSASAAIAIAQSSAASAISRANAMMTSAQGSASSAQSDASKAVLQAGAAVAAATGSAAAAGSSFLAAAAKATQSAQASVSAIGAAASQQVSAASQQVVASQTAAITATQAALAIVGSIIASTLITILIYFLLIRHKRIKHELSLDRKSKSPTSREYFGDDSKFPPKDQDGSTLAPTQPNVTNRPGTSNSPLVAFSLFPAPPTTGDSTKNPTNPKAEKARGGGSTKTTSLPWNPSNPPPPPTLTAPTLTSWLKLQAPAVSPFGPINLPTDIKTPSPGPLGGQLKSPLQYSARKQPSIKRKPSQRSIYSTTQTQIATQIPIPKPIPASIFGTKTTVSVGPITPLTPQNQRVTSASPPTKIPIRVPRRKSSLGQNILPTESQPPVTVPNPFQNTSPSQTRNPVPPNYRESKASVWTDEVFSPSPPPPRSPYRPNSNFNFQPPNSATPVAPTAKYGMQIPSPRNPIRNTAEWLAEAAKVQDNDERKSVAGEKRSMSPTSSQAGVLRGGERRFTGMENGNGNGGPRMGLPSGPRMGLNKGPRMVMGNGNGGRRSLVGVIDGEGDSRDERSVIQTPGVGKAL